MRVTSALIQQIEDQTSISFYFTEICEVWRWTRGGCVLLSRASPRLPGTVGRHCESRYNFLVPEIGSMSRAIAAVRDWKRGLAHTLSGAANKKAEFRNVASGGILKPRKVKAFRMKRDYIGALSGRVEKPRTKRRCFHLYPEANVVSTRARSQSVRTD